ncbi:MAG: segregation/condensation protein A [Clostridiales bacterium]|nr:segregation/condensation protein A [Clostridiales bacterium]
MRYKVKLEVFEGPLELLVYLIEHARMSIYDIRISEITTQYIEHVADMRNRDIAVAQEFMVLAAELIELKSRMLLPRHSGDDELDDDDDPRAGLVARILEYKRYKNMAAFLDEQAEAVSNSYTKPQEDLSEYIGEEEELIKSDMREFVRAFRAFIFRRQQLEEMHKIYERSERRRMSVETRTAQIKKMFKGRNKLRFSEMISDDKSLYNQVITFISILDLLSEGTVLAEQKKRYGDIIVRLVEKAAVH